MKEFPRECAVFGGWKLSWQASR